MGTDRKKSSGTPAVNGRFWGIIAGGVLLLAGCTYHGTSPGRQDPVRQDMGAAAEQKLSPDLRSVYRGGRQDRTIGVLVTTKSPLTPPERHALEKASICVTTVSGNVFTAVLKLEALPLLAGKPFVRTIMLSRELHPLVRAH